MILQSILKCYLFILSVIGYFPNEAFSKRKNLNMFADRRAKVERNSNEWQRCTRMLRFAWKPRYCSRLSIPAKDLPSAV